MEGILGLHHVALHTRNTERSINFYSMLGAKMIDQTVTYVANKPGHYWKLTLLELNGFVIELKEPSFPEQMILSDDGYFNHICLKVNNIEIVVKQLQEKGVNTFIEPIFRDHSIYSPGGLRNSFFRGPDGEQIELIEYK
ncbi:MAG: VOC family protein [Peptococcaceae bacterium]|jgi:catechol 2,3-dioxygenase-like lactoylglutathione lyase family enzyme|nr:VOC family protein [Peptococcaceae bacterium]